jgi:LysR family glycine cleavage system transcriptional activator
MKRHLLPLNALRAFEVAARTTNFTLAGRELEVSQGAISRHIAQLEAFLGRSLFHRTHRDLRLTPEGTAYALAIRGAFDKIDQATTALIHRDDNRPLRIKLGSTAGIRWLVPRLGRFHALHPDVDLQITTSNSQLPFDTEDVDFAMHILNKPRSGPGLDPLFEVELLPVCAPDFLKTTPESPAELLHHPLLHSMQRTEDWRTWLVAAGHTPQAISVGLRFSNSALVYQAAVDHMGIAIAHKELVREELASGRLVQAYPFSVRTGETYCLMSGQPSLLAPQAVQFRDWLMEDILANDPQT